jgi:outer membrane protein assembly factor BamA
MSRVLPSLLVFFAASSALGQDMPDPASGSGDVMDLSSLDMLADVPLPGESDHPVAGSSSVDLHGLEGLSVVEVTVENPPAGFHPIEEAAITLGISLDRSVARKAIKRLWETGNYRKIDIFARNKGGGGVELVIRVELMLRVSKVEINGNKAMSADDIEHAIDHVPDGTISPTAQALVALRDKLNMVYKQRGYHDANATLRMETTDRPGKVALVIDVVEGRPQKYRNIRITGLPDDIVHEKLIREIDLKHRMVRDHARIEEAMEKLQGALAKRGYLDSVVGKFTEKREGRYSFTLTIPVDVGIRTRLSFIGNRRLSKRHLLEALEKSGAIHSTPGSLEIARNRLKSIYRSAGLYHARIESARICMDEERPPVVVSISTLCGNKATEQEVVFKIEEGPPVGVARITVTGNENMDRDEIVSEIFAYMLERNGSKSQRQPLNTRTLDALGVSDPRPGRMGRPKGALTPTTEPSRIYIPDLYLAAMEHLRGLYQERGYLKATVVDTCDIESQKTAMIEGTAFRPFKINRDDAEESGLHPCVFIDEDLDSLLIAITVNEGPQTTLADIRVEGNDPNVFTEAKLLAKLGLSSGQPYNEYRLKEAVADLESIYRSAGYMFATVSSETSLSTDGRIADVVFRVNEGVQVRVNRIIVRGNVKTLRVVIDDRIRLKSGDLITPEVLSRAEQRLMELGFFDSVTVYMASPQEPSRVKNVVVKVEEAKQFFMEMMGGMAVVDGVRGKTEFGWRNMGGTGLNFRIRLRANYRLLFPGKELKSFESRYRDMTLRDQLERHFRVGFDTPHVIGTGGLIGASTYYIQSRENHPSFSADNKIIRIVHLTSNYLRYLPIDAHTGIEIANVELASSADDLKTNPRFAQWARMPEGKSTFWVTGLRISLDMRDDVFNPSKGIFVSAGGDLVRSLTNFEPETIRDEYGHQIIDPETGVPQTIDRLSNLIRAKAVVSGYIPLIGKKMVLALTGSLGYVFHLQEESTTWADRYFYMGGVETLRGFFKDSVVPEDVYQDWKRQIAHYSDEAEALLDARGGESMFLLRAEFRFPMAKGFHGGLFTEAGNVWRKRDNLDPLKLRPVSGIGLRYMTPIGPISFDLGINLNKRPHEDRFAWFFSIGSAF